MKNKKSKTALEDKISKILKAKEKSSIKDSDYKNFNNFIIGLESEGLLENPIYELPSLDTTGRLLFSYKRN